MRRMLLIMVTFVIFFNFIGCKYLFDDDFDSLFEDRNLEELIRDILDQPKGEILISDLEEITILDGSFRNIESIEGLQFLINLEELRLDQSFDSEKRINDITPLASLTNLIILSFANNNVENIDVLTNLENLERLILFNNKVSDISSLNNLTNLQFLDIGENLIDNINDINQLINLENLSLLGNNIENIDVLENFIKLENLWLQDNNIEDIRVFDNLNNIKILNLSNNNIDNIIFLENLSKINRLFISNNNIEDLTGLVNNDGFQEELSLIDITFNYLDITEGSQNMIDIQLLKDRGIDVFYDPQK